MFEAPTVYCPAGLLTDRMTPSSSYSFKPFTNCKEQCRPRSQCLVRNQRDARRFLQSWLFGAVKTNGQMLSCSRPRERSMRTMLELFVRSLGNQVWVSSSRSPIRSPRLSNSREQLVLRPGNCMDSRLSRKNLLLERVRATVLQRRRRLGPSSRSQSTCRQERPICRPCAGKPWESSSRSRAWRISSTFGARVCKCLDGGAATLSERGPIRKHNLCWNLGTQVCHERGRDYKDAGFHTFGRLMVKTRLNVILILRNQ